MLSFAAGRSWPSSIRMRLLERVQPSAASRFCEEHPGTLRVGRVLSYGETFDETISELLATPESLVLLGSEGTVVLEVPSERVRDVQCGRPAEGHDRHLAQNEEHLFVSFENEAGGESRLEISVGALDDVGPVHQLCECLRARVGLDSAAPRS